MEKFTASNGISVMRNPDDGPDIDYQSWSIGNAREVLLAPHEIDALREFFQAEWDQELGRWRWPENPDYVVYRDDRPGGFRVMHEPTGDTWTYFWDAIKDAPEYAGAWDAARAYFAAHPEPKPWHDAKPGEVWACVQSDHPGEEHAYWVNDNGSFIDVFDGGGLYGDDRECIESARRIWPGVSDDV